MTLLLATTIPLRSIAAGELGRCPLVPRGHRQDEEHSFPQTGCQAQSPGHQTDRVRHATRAPHPGRTPL